MTRSIEAAGGCVAERPEARTLSHLLAILLIILLGLPLLTVFLGTGDTVDMMEQFNLVPVKEAYRDGHWLVPTLNGQPRLEKPPLAVWLPAGMATLAGNDSLWMFRLPAAIVGVLTAIATYGLGCVALRDRRAGLIAAIILLTMVIWLRHARLATYDVFSTGFLTLGLLGLLAMIEQETRRSLWAVVAGVGIGLSVLSKGPVPVATVCLPLGMWILAFHRRRPDVWINLAVAAVVSLIVFVPWLLAVGMKVPGAWGVWYREILQNSTAVSNNPGQTASDLKRPAYYYVQFLAWVAPHIPLMLAGLALPFLKEKGKPSADAPERRGRWAMWTILLGGLILLSLLAEKKPRYAMPLFPVAAVLCASVWLPLWRVGKGKTLEAGAVVLVAAQALFFVVPGVALLALPLVKIKAPWYAQAIAFWHAAAGALTAAGVVIAALAMIFLGVAVIFMMLKRRWVTAAGAAVAAAFVMVLTMVVGYRSLPENYTNPVRPEVQRVLQHAGDEPVYTLYGARPWLSALYYADRTLPELRADEVVAKSADRPSHPLYLLVIVNDNFRKSKTAIEAQTGRELAAAAQFYDEQTRAETGKGNLNELYVLVPRRSDGSK